MIHPPYPPHPPCTVWRGFRVFKFPANSSEGSREDGEDREVETETIFRVTRSFELPANLKVGFREDRKDKLELFLVICDASNTTSHLISFARPRHQYRR
jgi:hypothetical protein